MSFAAITTVVARLNADSVGLVPLFLAPPHGSLLVLTLRVLKRILFYNLYKSGNVDGWHINLTFNVGNILQYNNRDSKLWIRQLGSG